MKKFYFVLAVMFIGFGFISCIKDNPENEDNNDVVNVTESFRYDNPSGKNYIIEGKTLYVYGEIRAGQFATNFEIEKIHLYDGCTIIAEKHTNMAFESMWCLKEVYILGEVNIKARYPITHGWGYLESEKHNFLFIFGKNHTYENNNGFIVLHREHGIKYDIVYVKEKYYNEYNKTLKFCFEEVKKFK